MQFLKHGTQACDPSVTESWRLCPLPSCLGGLRQEILGDFQRYITKDRVILVP